MLSIGPLVSAPFLRPITSLSSSTLPHCPRHSFSTSQFPSLFSSSLASSSSSSCHSRAQAHVQNPACWNRSRSHSDRRSSPTRCPQSQFAATLARLSTRHRCPHQSTFFPFVRAEQVILTIIDNVQTFAVTSQLFSLIDCKITAIVLSGSLLCMTMILLLMLVKILSPQ